MEAAQTEIQKKRKKPKTVNEVDRFWKFKAQAEAGAAELILYGEISSYSWFDDEITPGEFNKDLGALGNVSDITVRINSGGGDVFAALAIYTRLKDHTAKIKVKIDGWCASAATLIACAADEGCLEIPDSGVYMIHDPKAGISGYFTAEELTQYATKLETVKQSIRNVYINRTGKNEAEILQLMSKESWYTGKEAVDARFCDKLMFEEVKTQIENDGKVFVNSIHMNLDDFHTIPKRLLEFNNKLPHKKKEETKPMTGEEFKTNHPEEYGRVKNEATMEGVTMERKRIQEIDNLTLPGFEDLAEDAKFKNPVSAMEFLKQQTLKQKEQGSNYLKNRETDVNNSGMAGVKADGVEGRTGETDPYGKIIDDLYPETQDVK